jgi:hypothetical protein
MEKIWKKIANHNYYLVSNSGEIKSLKRDKILTPRKSDRGYLSVLLYYDDGKKYKSYRIHRLVLSSFSEVDYTLFPLECNHLDEDKSNNSLSNLAWATRKENMNWNNLSQRIIRIKYLPKTTKFINAIKEANSKSVTSINIKTGEKKDYKSLAEARNEGFNAGNISACCLGKRKKHKGFHWKYLEVK